MKIAHAISHEVGGIGSAIKGMFHKKPSLVKTASHDQPQGSSIARAAIIPQTPEKPVCKKWWKHGIGAPDVPKTENIPETTLTSIYTSEGLLEFRVGHLDIEGISYNNHVEEHQLLLLIFNEVKGFLWHNFLEKHEYMCKGNSWTYEYMWYC
ncbi:hypothetical protein L3X38_016245 [Prunus dulcis]|uniref:Uncharacterized protein n=1 Tax=Prunus dulcis TaxID=3755 RepID=A0AAD4W7G7_PRUDU|nr:hypothetical protein L3X38_016245 [Prunus dulcis]